MVWLVFDNDMKKINLSAFGTSLSAKVLGDMIRGNIFIQLIRRLLVVFLLYQLCRLVFLAYNYDFYRERTFEELVRIFLGGLKFDTTAIFYLNSVYMLMMLLPFKFRYNRVYQTVGKYIYFVMNGVGLAANCADTVYFRFTLQRTTFSVFREFGNEDNLMGIFAEAMLTNWYLVLFFLALMVVLVLGYGRRLPERSVVQFRSNVLYYPVSTGVFLVSVWLTVIGIRGGFGMSTRPISLNDAAQYVKQPIDVPLVLNTPFSFLRSMEYFNLPRLVYFQDTAVLDSIYTPVHVPPDTLQPRPMNVVVMIMESFGKEHVGFYNRQLEGGTYRGYTPFLDSLAAEGLTFTSSYANGRKSIDALASVMLSVPAIPTPYVLSPYFNNRICALPCLLRADGYETAFFCGQPNSGMGFQAFCNLLGFEHFFGMNEYGDRRDFDGFWGIWDEEFLQYMAGEIGNLQEPFLASVFTLSSHHPFNVPERYRDTFPDGVIPLHKTIRYSDYAIRRFFSTASEQLWFDNTLFVLVADHINGTVHEEYNNPADQFAVPVIFYKPDGSLKEYRTGVAQQNDIMPTVLGYLNYNKPYLAFGFDLNKNLDNFAVNYNNGTYQLYAGNYLLHFDGNKTTGLYELHTDMSRNLMDEQPETVAALERKIKAYLQQYTSRMIDDRLTVNDGK